MQIIDNDRISLLNNEVAATIGFFDGVHAGHRFLFEQLKTQANAHNLPSMVITFQQHPKSVLQFGLKPKLLNTFKEKKHRLSLSGIDYCLLLDFTESLSQLTAKEFIQKKLKEEWNVRLLLIGYDHRFGKNRAEGFEEYIKYCQECGIKIIKASELPNVSISSTHIRNCLSECKITEANRMLSYNYTLVGIVTEGNRLGKKIGFPTANLDINDKDKIIPGEGIYAAWVHWRQQKFGGMVYIGKRPTVTAFGEQRIEVHLFDFSKDLYGEELRLEFVNFLREDKKFEGVEELKKQLRADMESANAVLARSV